MLFLSVIYQLLLNNNNISVDAKRQRMLFIHKHFQALASGPFISSRISRSEFPYNKRFETLKKKKIVTGCYQFLVYIFTKLYSYHLCSILGRHKKSGDLETTDRGNAPIFSILFYNVCLI